MNRLENNELMMITGGFSITGTIINAFVSAGKFIYETGRGLGSAIRRISSKNLCSLN